jgi:ubiquinone/menaquinone biosynthesis C-methylase UbiE
MFNKSKAKQLNKKAASSKFKPDEVIRNLNIKPGDIVADVGSGGGFFSFEFAKRVGDTGKVMALDTEPELLDYIKEQMKIQSINNVQPTLIKNDDLGLAENGVDLMFLRNVYHHLPEPIKYFARIKKYLKPHGRVAIIEYKKRRFNLFLWGKYYTPEADIVNTMTKCGYNISNRFDFLPEQSFVIFRKG